LNMLVSGGKYFPCLHGGGIAKADGPQCQANVWCSMKVDSVKNMAAADRTTKKTNQNKKC
jgi:hypothetical protein